MLRENVFLEQQQSHTFNSVIRQLFVDRHHSLIKRLFTDNFSSAEHAFLSTFSDRSEACPRQAITGLQLVFHLLVFFAICPWWESFEMESHNAQELGFEDLLHLFKDRTCCRVPNLLPSQRREAQPSLDVWMQFYQKQKSPSCALAHRALSLSTVFILFLWSLDNVSECVIVLMWTDIYSVALLHWFFHSLTFD